MNGDNNNMDDLLVKQLLGEADAAELTELEQWLQQDEANRKYSAHFRLIWEQSKNLAANSQVNEQAAWDRFRKRVDQPATAVTTEKRQRFIFPAYLRAAALLLVLISLGLVFFLNRSPEMQLLQASAKPLTATLPDGSVITLNAHASLSYPERFNGDRRSVQLTGEAFFNISPDKTKPFIIDANGVSVKVVGTSFNVKSSSGRTEVIVETGIVEVSKAEQAITLHPNEKTVVDKDSRSLVKEPSADVLYHYYRTNEFVCNNTPVWRLAEILSEAFQVQIVIGDPSKRELPISTTFKNEQLDQILTVICTTLDLQATRTGNRIILE